jgi:hypothetical protein
MSACMSPGKRSAALLILRPRNVNDARTSDRRPWQLDSLSAPCGLPNDKASSWWRWCKPQFEKLIFHRSRRLHSRQRWLDRRES